MTSRNVERILGKTKANFGDIPLSKDVYVAEMCFDDMDSSPYFTIQLSTGDCIFVNSEHAMVEYYKYCKFVIGKRNKEVTKRCLTIPNYITDKQVGS